MNTTLSDKDKRNSETYGFGPFFVWRKIQALGPALNKFALSLGLSVIIYSTISHAATGQLSPYMIPPVVCFASALALAIYLMFELDWKLTLLFGFFLAILATA
ncbi:hypothetical protein P245_20790 [Comamonas thiooxydans]|uniref:Uncharacterized protein n=1 Tax=Comamonas thiooxydans TaxID=363952 RepID=A0A0E3B9P4_9BURK|nr:hypothetical protein [Comamonas thiooxydans]KGG86157.1 hypothetical protein P245_20790 [Comamonas thiooxydans]